MRYLLPIFIFLALPVSNNIVKSVPVASGGHVDVTLERTDVRFCAATAGSVLITSDPATFVEVSGQGDSVKIVVRGAVNGRKSAVSIGLPSSLTTSVRSVGRTIEVNGVTGSVSGSTAGGDIRIAGMKGEVHLTTAGGNIAVLDSTLDGSVHTAGGSVVVRGVAGNLKATSDGGRVTVEGCDAPLVVRAGAGPIVLDAAPNGADLATNAGDVNVKRSGGPLHIRTFAGNIRVTGASGSIDAETSAGNVVVDVAATAQKVRVAAEHGDIHLRLPENWGMTINTTLVWRRNSRDFAVHSPWPLTSKPSVDWDTTTAGPRRRMEASARVGDGAHNVVVSAIDGDIYLEHSTAAAVQTRPKLAPGHTLIAPASQEKSTPAPRHSPPTGPVVGQLAPPLNLTNWLKGMPVKRFARGRVYVIDIWAPWCGPCLGGMQHLTDLQRKNAARGLTVIGMSGPDNYGSTLAKAKKVVSDKGPAIGYAIAWDDGHRNFDRWMSTSSGAGWPWSFIIGRDGRVAYIGHPEKLDAVLDQLLAVPKR